MNNQKSIYLVGTITFVIVLLLIIFFLPFFNLTQSIGGGEYAQNTVYQIKSYNPLRPTILIIIPLSDEQAYFVVESEFTRTGINSLEPMTTQEEQDGFGSVDAKIYADSAQEAKQRYLDQQSGIQNQQDLDKEEYSAELDKPIECRRLLEFENKSTEISHFNFAKLGMNRFEFGQKIQESDLSGTRSFSYQLNNNMIREFRIDDSENSDAIKIQFVWSGDDNNDLEVAKTITLEEVNIVDKDCNILSIDPSEY
jgi:hypothetical protein